ncbi:uncharacterized protein [Euphorbia lathyris]|uniref:uncharacterized protein isoform X3 n=1 Tax=Euphorbia lathyris TaxID=212925 RepID=UPI00331425A4
MIQKLIQEASLHYLNHLTSAIQRWKGKGLSGHSRTILYVVDDLVREICPCYRFGKNMRRAGFGACFLQECIWVSSARRSERNLISGLLENFSKVEEKLKSLSWLPEERIGN